MKTFTFTPRSEVKRSVQYLDRTIEFESGAFQVQEIGINPIITFQMTFESMAAEMALLEAFYMEHRKSKNASSMEYTSAAGTMRRSVQITRRDMSP